MRLYFFLLALIFIYSCNSKSPNAITDKWFEKTKQSILNYSLQDPDTVIKESGRSILLKSIKNGKLLIQKTFRSNRTLESETNFSDDGLFELRKEICPNERVSFEGIFYKGEAYGLSTWWNCNGSIIEQGIRYKSEKIGWWKEKNSKGEIIEINYGNTNYIDSISQSVFN